MCAAQTRYTVTTAQATPHADVPSFLLGPCSKTLHDHHVTGKGMSALSYSTALSKVNLQDCSFLQSIS